MPCSSLRLTPHGRRWRVSIPRLTLATTYIQKNAAKYSLIDPAKMQVNVDNAQSDPNQFTVTIRYNAQNLPIWNLMTGLPLPDTTITRASTIRLGGI